MLPSVPNGVVLHAIKPPYPSQWLFRPCGSGRMICWAMAIDSLEIQVRTATCRPSRGLEAFGLLERGEQAGVAGAVFEIPQGAVPDMEVASAGLDFS